MGLFNKKKKKEEELEEEVLDEEDNGKLEKLPPSLRRKRIEDKEFKDLKSENKKKRKEPKKPWGKKERLIVFIVLIVTVLLSGFLALSSREWKLGGFPRLQAPKVEAPFLGEDTIIIEGKQKDKESSEFVTSSFNEETSSLTGVYGLYVVRLKNGYSYGVNEKELFQAASLIKLPVIAAMYAEAEKGNIDLDEKYILQASDKVGGSGSLYGKPVGYEITLRNVVELMGKQSDNTAFRIARKTLGDGIINDYIKRYGMTKTSLEDNMTTPEDIGQFFEGLWNNNILSQRNKNAVLDSLTDTWYEAWLDAGVPEEIRTAHKYGREVHVINDAGIVFSEEPYVIVLMSKGVSDTEADQALPELSGMVFEVEGSL